MSQAWPSECVHQKYPKENFTKVRFVSNRSFHKKIPIFKDYYMFCAKHLTLAIVLYCNSIWSNFYITSWTLQSSKLNMKHIFPMVKTIRAVGETAISMIRPFKQNNRTFTFLDRNTDVKKQDCIMLCLFRKI